MGKNALTLARREAALDLAAAWQDAMALEVAAGELSPNTLETYANGVRRLLDYAHANGHRRLTVEALWEWKAYLHEAGMRQGTVNVWLFGVKRFLAWAVAAGLLEDNPAERLRSKKRDESRKHLREPLSDDEMRRLLALPDTGKPDGVRDLAILSLLAYTALRTVELHRANVDGVQTRQGRLVLVVQGKGRSEADDFVVIENTPAASAVSDWLAVRGRQTGPLFVSMSNNNLGGRLSRSAIRHLVKRYLALAGVDNLERKTTHSLRHTAITNAIRNGAAVYKVQSMARHASLDTTMIYVHEIDRISDPAEGYISY